MSQDRVPAERRLRPLDLVWILIGVAAVAGGIFVLPRVFDL
jgi:hypothetical protein